MDSSISAILIFLSSYISTFLIFLNFLAILPRLENRYWFFWWFKNKKQFRKLNINEKYKKQVKSIYILTGSQLFYIIEIENTKFLERNKETGNLMVPNLLKITKDPNASKKFFLKRKIDKTYNLIFQKLQTDIPFIGYDLAYIVAGPSANKEYDEIYLQGTVKLLAFDKSLEIQNLMFQRTWNKKFDQIK